MGRLTAVSIKILNEPIRYRDGNGLYLNVSSCGQKSWVHRITIYGIRRDMGLGWYPTVGL